MASQGYRDHLVLLTGLVSLEPTYPYPSDLSGTPRFPLGQQIGLAATGPGGQPLGKRLLLPETVYLLAP